MNKLHLLKKAENLYCIENYTPDMIAEKLNISRRTVFNWKKKYKWENSNRIKYFSKQFTGEIYSLGAKLLKKINEDLDNNRISSKHSVCALEEIIKIIAKREKEQATMGLAHRKLERYKHLYDRFSEILKFETFGVNDLKQIFDQLAEIKITLEAIEYIHKKFNRFRQIVQLINQLEIIARENNLDEINMEVISQIL